MIAVANRALTLRRANPFGQFGQANTSASNYGATGCTDTCLQFLAKLLKNVSWTHNGIRAKVGHTNRFTGLTYGEVGAFLRAAGLPYLVKTGFTADQMLSLAKTRGPVLVGEIYGWHPEWQGYRGLAVAKDGKPNGFSRPINLSGRNQFNWSGRHAVLLLAYVDANHVYVMEPNHDSGARPENVAYDVITLAQFRALVAAYARSTGQTYCAYPTKTLS